MALSNSYLRVTDEFNGQSGTWVHVSLVYAKEDNDISFLLYINGKYIQTDRDRSYVSLVKPAGVLQIGRTFNSSSSDPGYSKTVVDELMFWNRQLSEDEIDTIHNS